MKNFARLQAEFQHAILHGDDTVLEDILDSPKQTRAVLFDVYRNGYGSRLAEVMRNNFEALHIYLGDTAFDAMAQAYIAGHPSRHANLRWYSRDLQKFLSTTLPYSDHRILAELAAFETALNDAFDARDGRVLQVADLAATPPGDWQNLRFVPHASTRRLTFATNASALWSALKQDEEPPEAKLLDAPEHLIVWRNDVTSMFRVLPAEESMMWDEAANGIPFGTLCAMLATYDDPDGAAGRAAGYLGAWVNAGMLASAAADI